MFYWSFRLELQTKLFWFRYYSAYNYKTRGITYQAKNTPKIFVKLKSEPGPNPIIRARPNLQLCTLVLVKTNFLFGDRYILTVFTAVWFVLLVKYSNENLEKTFLREKRHFANFKCALK